MQNRVARQTDTEYQQEPGTMQELDFDHIQINLNPRACAVTPIPEDLKRELAYPGLSQRKKFAASLITY